MSLFIVVSEKFLHTFLYLLLSSGSVHTSYLFCKRYLGWMGMGWGEHSCSALKCFQGDGQNDHQFIYGIRL